MTTDLVVLSLQGWDEVWRRNQHLIAGLLRERPEVRALFVEPPAQPWRDLLRHRSLRRGRGLAPVQDVDGITAAQLWRYQPSKWWPNRGDRLADPRITRGIREAVARIGFTEPLLWISDPQGATLLAETGWPAVYDIAIDLLATDRPPGEHERLLANEEFLLREVQEVVVCSPALARAKATGRKATVVANAADVDLLRAPAARPSDLPAGPVAVYAGTIHTDRVDLDLCELTARALNADGACLVLVGPDALQQDDLARLHAAGVVVLGPKPYREVPGYLQHADALVLPHLVNDFTESLDPIQLYEYQATGRPVVSTPVAGFRDAGSGVQLAAGDAFAAAVRDALKAGGLAPSVAVGDVPTWDDRVDQVRALIDQIQGAAHQ